MVKGFERGGQFTTLGKPDVELPDADTTGTKGYVPSKHVPLGVAQPDDLVLPNETLTEALPEDPSILTTVATNIAPTGRDWANALIEGVKYDADPYYKPQADTQDFIDANGIMDSRDVAVLNGAESYEEHQALQQRILNNREGDKAMAAHPVFGIVASMLDIDALAFLAPNVGGVVTAGKLGRAGQRISQGATLAAGAYGLNVFTEPNQMRSDEERMFDIVTFGLTGVLSNVRHPKRIADVDTPTAKPDEFTEIPDGGIEKGVIVPPVKPSKATLDEQVDAELGKIKEQLGDAAKKQGELGEVDILGVDKVKIPISNTARTDLKVPDFSKKYGWAANLQSSADTMWYITGGNEGNLLNRVLAAPRTQGDNAAYRTVQYQAEMDSKLIGLERAIDKAARIESGYHWYLPMLRKQHTQAQYKISEDFGKAMQELDQVVVSRLGDGLQVPVEQIHRLIDDSKNTDSIKEIMKVYVDSGFAESALALAKKSGLLDELDDVASIHSRPTYIPVRQSYDKIKQVIKSGLATEDEVAEMVGKQIMAMYPETKGVRWVNKEVVKDVGGRSVKSTERVQVPKTFQLTAKQLGQNFIQTQRELRLNISEVQTAGLTKEQMTKILQETTMPRDQINHAVNQIYRGTQSEGTAAPKQFRRRLGWDFNARYATSSGGTLTMGDLIDGNTFLNLNDYSRSMSHRMGLADYGIKTQSDFQSLVNETLDSLPKGVSVDKAKSFLHSIQEQAFGRPTGDPVPEPIRAAQTVAGSMLLNSSGLYTINDLATQLTKMGMLRSLPNIVRGMRNVIDPVKKLSVGEAKDLEDVLTGMLSMDGRWRDLTTRYSDDFDVSNGVYEYIEHAGQTTRFLNMSEYVKRMQIGMGVGTITAAMRGASKGRAKDIKYLRKQLNMSDQLVKNISTEYRKHGTNVDNWNGDVRLDMQQKVFYEMDNLAHTIRNGEIPAFMEHSGVGKVLFPFLSFAFAMQQKVLRNTYQRDGASGVALLAAVQFPTAILIAMAKNIKDGKEYDDNLAAGATNALSISGAFSIPVGMIMNGEMGGSAAATPIDGALGLSEDIVNGRLDVTSLTHAPILGSFTGLSLAINTFAED